MSCWQQACFASFTVCKLGLGGVAGRCTVDQYSQPQVLSSFNIWLFNAWSNCLTGAAWYSGGGYPSAEKATARPAEPDSEQQSKASLSQWLNFCVSTPPVRLLPGVEPPTALSWLRRRGPHLNIGTLQRLFRERQVRVFDGEKVKRVRGQRSLEEGDVLLVPKSQCADELQELNSPASGRGTHKSRASLATSEEAEGADEEEDEEEAGRKAAAAKLQLQLRSWGVFRGELQAEDVRRWVLGTHSEFVVLNKPSGVIVQGGGDSLAAVMGTALVYDREKDQPRLVHRLDRDVSGAMLVARNPDAAAWLAAAFREKSVQVQDTAKRGSRSRASDSDGNVMYIRRTYLALVARDMEPKHGGRVNGAVLVDSEYQSAVTHYRVLQSNNGMSMLQLVPETGRKHQLRIHCARFLHAPIVGDVRYGYEGDNVLQLAGFDKRSPCPRYSIKGAGQSGSIAPRLRDKQPIMLHSYSIVVSLPRKKPFQFVAPLPPYMMRVLQQLGWKPPRP